MIIDISSDAEYTSVSVALNHTVDMVPNARPPAIAATWSRVQRETRAVAIPADAAVHTAASRFVATAVERKNQPVRQARAIRMYSGVPGGCGIPNDSTADANSPASQSVTPGASVAR